jgi:hypothetical protein
VTAVASQAAPAGLWSRLDALVDGMTSVEAVLDHRLGGIAARRFRATGRSLPAALLEEERFVAAALLASPVVLERVAEAHGEPLMVLKGPEVAHRYPTAAMRPTTDLDLLVEDSAAAFRALVAAGCHPLAHVASPDHELPLVFPDLPLVIELHWSPKWPHGHTPPSVPELLAGAGRSAWRPDLALAPTAAQHAVMLAAHAWAHRPLCRLGELVDIAVLLEEADAAECESIARAWDVERIWNATLAACDAMLADGPMPRALRSWARNLPELRHRSRREMLLERCLAPFTARAPHRAAALAGASLQQMLRARLKPAAGQKPQDFWGTHPAVRAARKTTNR